MGTPLSSEIPKPDGSSWLSGTEWEYNDALTAAKRLDKPTILVYRRAAIPQLPINLTKEETEARRLQWERVNVEEWGAQVVIHTVRGLGISRQRSTTTCKGDGYSNSSPRSGTVGAAHLSHGDARGAGDAIRLRIGNDRKRGLDLS